MKKTSSLILLTTAVSVALVGCGVEEKTKEANKEKAPELQEVVKNNQKTKEDVDKAIKQVVLDNVKYSDEEDAQKYMSLFSFPNNEIYLYNLQLISSAFEIYDLDYDVISMDIIEKTETTAKIQVVQKYVATYVKEGYEYPNNIATYVLTLKLMDGEWKIVNSEIDQSKTQLLDEKGNIIQEEKKL
jgi:hypothetical protein